MSSKRVEFKTMTNLDDSEQNTQKDDEQTMEHEIRSAGNGAFDRSDILYLMAEKNELQSVEDRKRQQLDNEVANFRVNALNKKPTTVIAMKEKRQIAPPPVVMIKKKKQKVSSGDAKKSGSSIMCTVKKGKDNEEGVTDGNSNNSSTTNNDNNDNDNDNDKHNVSDKKTEIPPKNPNPPQPNALGGLLGDYSDSDSD